MAARKSHDDDESTETTYRTDEHRREPKVDPDAALTTADVEPVEIPDPPVVEPLTTNDVTVEGDDDKGRKGK